MLGKSPLDLPPEAHALFAELNLTYCPEMEYFSAPSRSWCLFVHDPDTHTNPRPRLRAWIEYIDFARAGMRMQTDVQFFPYVVGQVDEAIKVYLRSENYPVDKILRTKRLQALIS